MNLLKIGQYESRTPVVLAPMAGVTNAPFRKLCREYGEGFYVSQMVTSRALIERTPESMRLIQFDKDEYPRSLQLYGVDPATMQAAAKMVVEENLADHIDLNFGCPVAKVTRKGGGAALPWKHNLFVQIVKAVVAEASKANIPVTVKMRKGIDEDHLTYLDAARAAEEEGVAAVALHARTAAEHYSGSADWSAIAKLKETITSIPVLGNGDIWVAQDALQMVEETGCDGVVVGRGCLGRPWLFADLEAAFAGRSERIRPNLHEVTQVINRHAQLLAEYYEDEYSACLDMRKHVGWYLKGYSAGKSLRLQLVQIEKLEQLAEILASANLDEPYPGSAAEGKRGKQGNQKSIALPYGWLDNQEITKSMSEMIQKAEVSVSGG